MTTAHTASPGVPTSWPPQIRARYGITKRRWQPAAFVALLVVFFALVLVLGWRLATPTVEGAISSYTTVSDTRMDLTLDVVRRTDQPITCVLRARASDGFDVGYAVIGLPAAFGAASGTSRIQYRMATAYRALVGELVGCAPGGLPAGVTGAQFRPAVLPPSQPWRP